MTNVQGEAADVLSWPKCPNFFYAAGCAENGCSSNSLAVGRSSWFLAKQEIHSLALYAVFRVIQFLLTAWRYIAKSLLHLRWYVQGYLEPCSFRSVPQKIENLAMRIYSFQSITLNIACICENSGNGWSPVNISTTMQPRDHTSALRV